MSRAEPLAVIFGCAGPVLAEEERRFFARRDPLGFILFGRNIEDPTQLRALVAELRASVGRAAPILIDQEGGRVQRLRPPHWRPAPPPALFGALFRRDPAAAEEAAWLNARLMAEELAGLGIDVDCTPVLDRPVVGAHDVIGDRAFDPEVATIAALGRAVCAGMLAGGVIPVVKHIPGHGRALVDSHFALPLVEAPLAELEGSDFTPFRLLADAPWAMTAHVVYAAVDAERPASTSPRVIAEVVRRAIGFDGLLLSDDLSMAALRGDIGARAGAVLAAGCDVALHCNADLVEMEAIAAAAAPLTERARARLARAEAMRRREPLDLAAAEARLAELMA